MGESKVRAKVTKPSERQLTKTETHPELLQEDSVETTRSGASGFRDSGQANWRRPRCPAPQSARPRCPPRDGVAPRVDVGEGGARALYRIAEAVMK